MPVLAITVVGALLALGGAWNVAIPLFAATACVALFFSGVDRSTVRNDPAAHALALLLVVSVLQLVPLPGALLGLLDRAGEDASRYVWDAWRIDRASSWRPLHRDPGTGLVDLVYLFGIGAAYVAASQAARREVLERLYELCAASALLAALVGLAHLGTGQDRLYGFYRPVQAAPPLLSPLLNANHLAALTGAGAILWLGMALGSEKFLPRVLHGLAAVLCGAACALTLSRGGVASAMGGIVVLLALDARTEGEVGSRKPRRRPALQTFVGYGFAAAVFAAGAWLASASLAHEYGTGDTSKLALFRSALGLLRGHELLGYGSGAMPVVTAASGRFNPEHTFLRIESLPIDLALSVGVVAAAFTLYLGARALQRWLPPAGAPTTILAAWAAMVSLLVHDLVDFSLHLGGVGYFAAVLGGVLSGAYARGWRKALPRSEALKRWPAVVLLGLVAALGVVASHASLERERDDVEQALRASPAFFQSEAAKAAVARHPGDAYLQLLLGTYAVAEGHPASLRFVTRALALAPSWAQPHLLLARILAAGNRRSQALLEVREVLERTTTQPAACAQAALRLRPPPDRDELARVAPRNLGGVSFLNGMAQGAPTSEYAQMADALLLERMGDFVPALTRRASAARAAGDLDGARVYCERIERARPADPTGAVCRVEVLLARGDTDGALVVLDRALNRVHDRYPVHEARARLFAQLRRPADMRREVTAMLETAGAELGRLVHTHGLRGALESDLGNDRAAYSAYEMANALSVPDHPYAMQMAVVAARLGDREAVETQCVVLLEHDPSHPTTLQLCDRAGARRAGIRVEPDR